MPSVEKIAYELKQIRRKLSENSDVTIFLVWGRHGESRREFLTTVRNVPQNIARHISMKNKGD